MAVPEAGFMTLLDLQGLKIQRAGGVGVNAPVSDVSPILCSESESNLSMLLCHADLGRGA